MPETRNFPLPAWERLQRQVLAPRGLTFTGLFWRLPIASRSLRLGYRPRAGLARAARHAESAGVAVSLLRYFPLPVIVGRAVLVTTARWTGAVGSEVAWAEDASFVPVTRTE